MDIEYRFNKDKLVFSGSVESSLKRLNIDTSGNLSLLNVLEPDSVSSVLNSYITAECHCLLANTKDILPSILSHYNLNDKMYDIAAAALQIANSLSPQHLFVHLDCSKLPLDNYSKNSLNEFKNEYVTCARLFESLSKKSAKYKFDGYYLSNFKNTTQIKCALMGIRQVSDKAICVCSHIDKNGLINNKENYDDYINTLMNFGSSIIGISFNYDYSLIKSICKKISEITYLPLMAEIRINEKCKNLYDYPESMTKLAVSLFQSGVQFVRAADLARPSHTAVLSVSANSF